MLIQRKNRAKFVVLVCPRGTDSRPAVGTLSKRVAFADADRTHKQKWHYYQIEAKSSGAHYKWGLYLRLLNLLKCWPLKWAKTGMWDRIFLYTQWWEQFLRKTKNWQHGLTYKKELVIRIKLAPWKLKMMVIESPYNLKQPNKSPIFWRKVFMKRIEHMLNKEKKTNRANLFEIIIFFIYMWWMTTRKPNVTTTR